MFYSFTITLIWSCVLHWTNTWPVCLFVCVFIYLLICLLVCPSVWLSAHLSTCHSVSQKIFSSLYECYYLPFRKNTFLVINFELKHIRWWFWCLGLHSEGQGIQWQHSFWSLVCLSVCLSVCLAGYLSVHLSLSLFSLCLSSVGLSVCPSSDQSNCLPGLHRGQFTYSHLWL